MADEQTTADLTTLIKTLESASEGTRDLDGQIAEVIAVPLTPHLHPDNARWMRRQHAAHYTTSLDAALTLIQEGFDWEAGTVDCGRKWAKTFAPEPNMDMWFANAAASSAIAVCIAALKSRVVSGAQQ